MIDFDPILLASEGAFAEGASTYVDAYPDWNDPHSRIYVRFRPEGVDANISFLALLDTGGHYCILNEDVAALVRERLVGSLGPLDLLTAHGLVRGDLYLLRIELVSDVGEDLDLETVVFVSADWRGPNYIGYTGVLDRLRFAVNPASNRFYFGRLS